MAARKSLTVHYRRLEDPVGAFNGATLEQAIRNAMAHVDNGSPLSGHWGKRAWAVPPDNADTLLMNLYHDEQTGYFGDLTGYTAGYLQALLCREEDAPMLSVEQQPPPEGSDYIHSIMYWMVVGNHLLTIQSRSLNTKHLEQYFTWLLKDKTAIIGNNGQVILNAKFDSDEVGGDLEDVKEIIVGGTGAVAVAPVYFPEQNGEVRTVERHTDVDARRSWGDRAIQVLRAVMNNEADVQSLLQSIPEEADLNVSVHIGYKSRSRRVSRAPMQQALRNIPEGEITAIGKHGRSTGKDIRLSYPVQVKMTASLPDPEDVRAKLRSAYDYFVENGKITA